MHKVVDCHSKTSPTNFLNLLKFLRCEHELLVLGFGSRHGTPCRSRYGNLHKLAEYVSKTHLQQILIKFANFKM
jgi:hypothetical protein